MATGRSQEAPIRVEQPHRRTTLGSGGGNWPVCSAHDSLCCRASLPSLFRDEKWVKNWFTRQRSKVAARHRKGHSATTRVHSATVPTFKLQLFHPPAVPTGLQGLPSRRSVSTPIDSAPYLTSNSYREPSPASVESCSSQPPRSPVNAQAIHCSHRSASAPTYLNNPPQNPALVPHTTTIPTYSRDPLCNRYPDFSQFFRPQVHERFRSSELSGPVNNHNHLIQLLANPNMDSHAPMHIQGLFNLLDPLHLGSLPTHQNSSAYLRSCPVAFSMRLVDLLGHH